MLKGSKSLPDIAVLRGGKKEFEVSLSEGKEVLQSLSKIGYKPIDVIISREGEWNAQGVPTDMHAVFTKAHTVIDTTRSYDEPHHTLAKKMGIPLLLSHGNSMSLTREDVYRLLRQQGIRVPDTVTIRAHDPLRDSLFRNVWTTHHTPLMVRPLVRREGAPSKLIQYYPELEETIRTYHDKGIDVHVLTYRKAPTSSIAVLPHFHNEELYTPLWVETFASMSALPNGTSPLRVHHSAPQFRKEQMKDFVTKVYKALDLSGPVCIDVIPHNDEYIVVNVDAHPSLRSDSRFSQSLASTGATIGQYIHSQIVSR